MNLLGKSVLVRFNTHTERHVVLEDRPTTFVVETADGHRGTRKKKRDIVYESQEPRP